MPFVKRHRDYYKYDYKDWTQPVLSSNTGYGKLTSSGVNESQCQPYSALNGVTSGAPSLKQGWISGSSTGWWKWELPVKLSVSAIKFYNPYSSSNVSTKGQFFIDEGVTPLTEAFSTSNSSWASYTLTVVNDTPTDIIYFKMTGGGSNGGIGELKITAREQISVAGTEADHDYHIDNNKLYQLATVKRSYYKYGTEPNATVIGSPTIVDGVVSGFSTSNYLKVPTTFNPESNVWNLVLKFNISNLNYQYILGSSGAGDYGTPLAIGVGKYGDANGKLLVSISSNSSISNDICSTQGTTILSINTDYWVKVEFTGTVYNVYLSTTGEFNGEENLEISVSSTSPVYTTNIVLGIYRDADGSILYGSIDLNESYININGEKWWHGTKAVELNINGFDIYQDWEQPVLTENGTLGGDSFAVYCDKASSSYPIYKAFDSSSSNFTDIAHPDSNIVIYNPRPLKVTTIRVANRSDIETTAVTGYTIYGSNDNSSWEELVSGTNDITSKGSVWDIDLSSNTKGFKYYKIDITSAYISTGTYQIAEITLIAQELKAIGGTVEDADYYTDNIINYSQMTSQTKYYKYAYQDWEQPVLTENGTMGGDKFAVNQSSLLDSSEDSKAWNAFDGVGATTRWHSAQSLPAWISWYNPNPLKISNVEVTNRASSDGAYPNAYQLQYSDDNSTWVTAVSGNGTSGNGAIWNIPVEHDAFHKYWRLYITSSSGSNSGYTTVGEIVITAQEQITVETTSSDYDWYERRTKMY